MKKNLILAISLTVLALPSLAYTTTTSNTSGDGGPINNPNAGISGLKPGYEDTYYTHYKTITGYKSNGKWGF